MLQNKPTLFSIIRNYYLPLEYICTLLIGSFFTFGFLGLGGPSALAALDFIGSYKKINEALCDDTFGDDTCSYSLDGQTSFALGAPGHKTKKKQERFSSWKST